MSPKMADETDSNVLFTSIWKPRDEDFYRNGIDEVSRCAAHCIPKSLPNYKICDQRLDTFKYWPCKEKIRPEQLAKAGFWYTGNADRCQCAWCNIVIHSWEYFDEPLNEHRRHNKDCSFLKMILPSHQ